MIKILGVIVNIGVIILSLTACVGTQQTEVSTLIAAFTASPTEGTAPLSVNFSDESSGTITNWKWDFGDGESSELQQPNHQYNNPGTYTVTLTITGESGSATKTKSNYILVKVPMTEFYLGSRDASPILPRNLTVGQAASITLGIVNQEGRSFSYWVRVVLGDEEVARTEIVSLNHLGRLEQEVRFTPKKAGSNQKLEFELYREGDTKPYLEPLYLWVDVRP